MEKIKKLKVALETAEAKLAATPSTLRHSGGYTTVEDRWTGEDARGRFIPAHSDPNPAWYEAKRAVSSARQALASAERREKEEAASAEFRSRRVSKADKFCRVFSSPEGKIEVSNFEGDFKLAIRVELVNGKTGSSHFSLEKLELERSSYLTGEPRRVAESFCAMLAKALADAEAMLRRK